MLVREHILYERHLHMHEVVGCPPLEPPPLRRLVLGTTALLGEFWFVLENSVFFKARPGFGM